MNLTRDDLSRIEESIHQKYVKVASSPEGQFRYPTGRAALEGLGYPKETIEALSDKILASYCGVGNPFRLGPIHKGEAVLDIGCGAGVDTIIAAFIEGPEGRALGMDMTSEMLERAMENLHEVTLGNVIFQQASAENLPFPDHSFDVVISNGVFNLVPDKAKALSEVFRVLKPSGRFMLADQILAGRLPGDSKARVESWFS